MELQIDCKIKDKNYLVWHRLEHLHITFQKTKHNNITATGQIISSIALLFVITNLVNQFTEH